ncbi:MAG: GHKL domain-containing protein, partial [Lachnospiraceae bacterium]|nr:GHKL domain-containing protein [Lachnospiraceae bacterium]
IKLEMAHIDIVELVQQTNGEFEEKFMMSRLNLVSTLPNEVLLIEADGRRLWRVLENLYNNACKYAMENTRVYVGVEDINNHAVFTIKNISASPLNISPDELTERFVRGDVSRTTEGSGLGLSIAKSLTTLQGGELRITIDGDLYKAEVIFPIIN